MSRCEFILAALAPAKGESHGPAMVQKLAFILGDKLPDGMCDPPFKFMPYDYGPYDGDVYRVLEELGELGLLMVCRGHWRSYRLTVKGQKQGSAVLRRLTRNQRRFVREVSAFVRRLTFTQLISAIYKAYPEMAVNAVFAEQR